MASPPFTKPIQNGARIAALLINEGTTAMRKHFEKSIKNTKQDRLSHLLKEKKAEIQSHFKGDNSKNIPFTQHQMDLLYPTKGTAKLASFDITLLAQLLRLVCDVPISKSTNFWTKRPDDRDFSLAADVVRLRNLRNVLYGHITNTGMDDSDFERHWKTLEDILIRLEVPKEDVDKWRSYDLDGGKATKLMEEVTQQVDNDIETLHEMSKVVKTLKDDNKKLEKILNQFIPICNPHIQLSISAQDTLKHIEEKYQCSEGSSIFILIMNGPSGKDDCRELGTALGYVPWHIIIDLDHKSKGSTGLFDCVTQTLEKQKEILTVSYKETKTLSDDDKVSVASGDKSLWIQANGCCVKNYNESLNKFSIAKHNIDCLIGEILETTPDSQNVLCTTLLMDKCENDTTNAFVKLLEVVHEACERNTDQCISDQYIGLATSVNQCVLDELQTKQDMLVGLATFSQIEGLMLHVFHKNLISSYRYPGNAYSCILSQEEMTRLSGTLVLYHHNYGKIDFGEDLADRINEKTSTIRKNFHKGDIITSEALYLDASHLEHIYVHRYEMKKIESELCRELELKQLKQKHSLMTKRELKHKPCSGGTTWIKHLLFSLKDKYPCVEVLQLTENASTTLAKMSSKSELPMLLAVDDLKFTTSDLNSFVSRLNNNSVLGVLIHTTRVKSDPICESWYVPAYINNETDLACFNKMYNERLKYDQTRRVFMFGFLTFSQNYTNFDERIRHSYENTTPNVMRVVRLACGVCNFGQMGLNTSIVGKLLGKSDRSMHYQLGDANDILIIDNHCNEIRPAVHQIVNTIMETLHPTSPGETYRRFIEDFKFMIENEHCTESDISPLVNSVFIQRGEWIHALEGTLGENYVISVLDELAEALRHHDSGKQMISIKTKYLKRLKKKEKRKRRRDKRNTQMS